MILPLKNFLQVRNVSRGVSLPFDVFQPKKRIHPDQSIVFLHGFLGNRKNNRSAAKDLSEKLGIDVYVPDLRNHGKAFHSANMNYKFMASDLKDFITTNQLGKNVYLMGHSMGGKLSMIYSVMNPDMVKGVISIDNVPYKNPQKSLAEFENFHIALREIELCVEKHPYWTLNELSSHLLKYVEPRKSIVTFYLTNMASSEGILKPKIPIHILRDSIEDVLEWRLEEFGDLEAYSNQHQSPPLLIIRAKNSEFVGDNLDTEEISRWFAKWECVDVLSNHWVVTEKKNEFVSIVCDWINKQKK